MPLMDDHDAAMSIRAVMSGKGSDRPGNAAVDDLETGAISFVGAPEPGGRTGEGLGRVVDRVVHTTASKRQRTKVNARPGHNT